MPRQMPQDTHVEDRGGVSQIGANVVEYERTNVLIVAGRLVRQNTSIASRAALLTRSRLSRDKPSARLGAQRACARAKKVAAAREQRPHVGQQSTALAAVVVKLCCLGGRRTFHAVRRGSVRRTLRSPARGW
jgi:hypothetical protein